MPPIDNGISKIERVSNIPNNWLLDSLPDKADITPSILSGLKVKLKAFAALTGFRLLNKIVKIGPTISKIPVVCADQSPFLILSAIRILLNWLKTNN